jgi:hypothetical protein
MQRLCLPAEIDDLLKNVFVVYFEIRRCHSGYDLVVLQYLNIDSDVRDSGPKCGRLVRLFNSGWCLRLGDARIRRY